jgi:hypothetical protein
MLGQKSIMIILYEKAICRRHSTVYHPKTGSGEGLNNSETREGGDLADQHKVLLYFQ